MEKYVLRLEIIVDHFVWQLVQVFYSINHLSDDHLGLFLSYLLMLLQVIGQVWAFAKLENGAKGSGVDLHRVIELHDIRVRQ